MLQGVADRHYSEQVGFSLPSTPSFSSCIGCNRKSLILASKASRSENLLTTVKKRFQFGATPVPVASEDSREAAAGHSSHLNSSGCSLLQTQQLDNRVFLLNYFSADLTGEFIFSSYTLRYNFHLHLRSYIKSS